MLRAGAPWPSAASRPRRLALAAIVVFAAIVRLPFWLEALRLPVDGDTSIVGLMAQHGRWSPTFWGQPYGSPLDAWLAAPFVALLGPTPLAVRLPYFLLGLALVPLAWSLAARLHPGAAAPAAFLAACPPAYLLLLAALPPPFYPSTLALLAALLVGALALGGRLAPADAEPPARSAGGPASLAAGLAGWGLAAGVALWTHLGAAAVVAPGLAYLCWRTRPSRGRLALVLLAAGPTLLLGSAPWWLRLADDPSATAVVSVGAGEGAFTRHLFALLPRMHEPILGLLGAHTPMTADDPRDHIGYGALGALALALLYGTGLWRAAQVARRAWASRTPAGRHAAGGALLLAAAAAVTLFAFPLPLRAGPETIRFLTPAWLPLAVLVAWAPAAEGHRRGAWLLTLTLALLHLAPATQLLAAWRQATPERPLLPDCRPVLRVLDAHGVRRAWASYDTAWCLTYLSGGRVVASQPWNERFYDHPLPYRDEVRFGRDVAWVLVPGADFDLPRPEQLEAFVSSNGGSCRRTEVAHAIVYDRFASPFPPEGSPPPLAARALTDGDVTTRVVEPGRGPTTLTLAAPVRASALTLVGGHEPPGLPRGLLVEASADGRAYETVLRWRPGHAARRQLVWANGHPQARQGLQVLSAPLGGRAVAALRLTPLPAQGPWSLAEVLLHPPATSLSPWPDELPEAADSTWPARRSALLAAPRPGHAGWQLRAWLGSEVR